MPCNHRFALSALILTALISIFVYGVRAELGIFPTIMNAKESHSISNGNYLTYLPLIEKPVMPVIPNTTVVIDDQVISDLLFVSADQTNFSFKSTSPVIQRISVNSIIVGGVSDLTPYGFLRKITNIEQQGEIVSLTTVSATLQDTIQEGRVLLRTTLLPESTDRIDLIPGVESKSGDNASPTEFYFELNDVVLYDYDNNPTTTNDRVLASGTLTFTTDVSLDVIFREGQSPYIFFGTEVQEGKEIEIRAPLRLELPETCRKTIAEQYLSPITIFVGVVPIILVPVIRIEATCDGSIEVGVVTRIKEETDYVATIEYRNGEWQSFGDETHTFSHTAPTLYGSFNLRGALGPDISLMFYGISGGYMSAQGFLELNANTSEDPWWELYAGYDVTAGLRMELLSERIESPEYLVIGIRQLLASAEAPPSLTTRFSISSNGTEGNNYSYGSTSVSADGRLLVFMSAASNLVDNDTNNARDVFVHDRSTGETTRVSISSTGAQSNRGVEQASISANGMFVSMWSYASNLVPNDTNLCWVAEAWVNCPDAFVHNRITGQTEIVSVSSEGDYGNGFTLSPIDLSAEGRFAVFTSYSSNLVINDTNNRSDIFIRDLEANETDRLSISSMGVQSNNNSSHPSISDNGRFVAFDSIATNLVTSDTNAVADVFLHDRQTGLTTLVSVASNGMMGNGQSLSPHISADGRYVAFSSYATNLVQGDTNNVIDAFVHDTVTGSTLRVSTSSNGTQSNDISASSGLSANGQFIVFTSNATNLVGNDTNNARDVFIYDLVTHKTTRVSTASGGGEGNGNSALWGAAISADGTIILFPSESDNLILNDTNNTWDFFVHERESSE